nr:DNA adenine methylase [Actinomyces sp.]
MRYLSPLRYPGGKARLAPLLAHLINAQQPRPACYAEPYAGGAGAALRLLSDGVVEHVHLNDVNPGIAALWRTITCPEGAKAFCDLIEDTPVTIEQWHHQRSTYQHGQADDLTLGFATFFLNRTNRSGILGARPIGGLDQTGRWGIDARFNKPALIERVQAVAALGERIHVTRLDGVDFLTRLGQTCQEVFVYADPPYVEQGPSLYLHAFSPSDHQRLAEHLRGASYPWVLTYDDQPVVRDRLYSWATCRSFAIAHTAARQHIGQETIIHSPSLTEASSAILP